MQARIESLKVDIREYKADNEKLQARVFELEEEVISLKKAWLDADIKSQASRTEHSLENVETRKNFTNDVEAAKAKKDKV